MTPADLVGTFAAICSMVSFTPQIAKILKERDASAVSLRTYGVTVTGFELQTKKGKTFVSDIVEAFKLAGLPQEEFLKACALRMNTSKKYPDQRGVVDIYAALHGLKKAPAKRDLLKKLEPVVKTGADSVYLKAVGGEDETEE